MNAYDLMKVEHSFGGGMYVKQCILQPNYKYDQHRHTHDHLSILADGIADVEVDGVVTRQTGPAILTIKARTVHSVTPITQVLWYCCHATDVDNVDNIDEEFIDRG